MRSQCQTAGSAVLGLCRPTNTCQYARLASSCLDVVNKQPLKVLRRGVGAPSSPSLRQLLPFLTLLAVAADRIGSSVRWTVWTDALLPDLLGK